MKAIVFFAVAFLASVPLASHAGSLDYSYLDLAYGVSNHDETNTTNGYGIAGSYDLGDGVFLDASYFHDNRYFAKGGGFSAGTLAFDLDRYQIGGGWHHGLSDSTEFVARLAYAHANMHVYFMSVPIDQNSHHGYDLGAGVRTALTPKLELHVFLDHDNVGLEFNTCAHTYGFYCATLFSSDATETVLAPGISYRLTDDFAIGLDYAHSSHEGANRLLVSGRWYF